MNELWKNFLRLFDGTFFRMSFQFLALVFLAFLVLLAVRLYEVGGEAKDASQANPHATVAR